MADMTKTYDARARVTIVSWDGYSTGDDVPAFRIPDLLGLMGSMQSTGGATTVALTASNTGADGEFVALNNASGDAVSISGDGMVEFQTAALEIKPEITGTNITVIIALRGV